MNRKTKTLIFLIPFVGIIILSRDAIWYKENRTEWTNLEVILSGLITGATIIYSLYYIFLSA